MCCLPPDMQDWAEYRIATGAKWTWSTLRCASECTKMCVHCK